MYIHVLARATCSYTCYNNFPTAVAMRAAGVYTLLFLCVVVEVNSQYPQLHFMGNILPDNSFVNVSQLGGGAYNYDNV